jgi:hypothetical protein
MKYTGRNMSKSVKPAKSSKIIIIIIIIIMLLKYNTIKNCCAVKTTYYLQL